MYNNYISDKRFAPSNSLKLSAEELQIQLNGLVNNDIPERVQALTMFDIFSDDENRFIPTGTITNVTVDGRTIALKDVLRGVANAAGGESAKGTDLIELAEYFSYVAKSLKDSVDKADAVRETNGDVRDNNIAIAQLTDVLRTQVAYERNMDQSVIAEICHEEALRNELDGIKSENAELKSNQESLMDKVAGLLKPKKASAKAAPTSK